MKRFYILIFIFIFNLVYSLPTNFNINIKYSTNNINFNSTFNLYIDFKDNIYIKNIIYSQKNNYNYLILSNNIINNKSIVLYVLNLSLSNYSIKNIIVEDISNSFILPDIPVMVAATNLKINELIDIESIYKFYDYLLFFIILISIILILLIIYLLFRFFKKRKVITSSQLDDKKEDIDPYLELQSAIEKLEKIEMTKENYKDQFSEISYILRRFLTKILKINILEMPTREIIEKIFRLNYNFIDKEFIENLKIVLKTTDRVKYAKHYPESSDKNELLQILIYLKNRIHNYYESIKNLSHTEDVK